MTEDEVEMMRREGGYLPGRLIHVEDLHDRVVHVQCTKPPEVVTRTADVLDKFGLNEEAMQLRGW